jgi:hypothetical protein
MDELAEGRVKGRPVGNNGNHGRRVFTSGRKRAWNPNGKCHIHVDEM